MTVPKWTASLPEPGTPAFVSPEAIPDWDERLVRSAGSYSFFHTSAWAGVLSRTYGYTPCYFTQADPLSFRTLVPLMDVSSRLTGHRGVSLPFSDYCDSFNAPGADGAGILDRLAQHARSSGWKYIEFRGGGPFPPAAPFAFHYGHRLDLDRSRERLFSGLDGAVRRNIRKALKEKVKIELNESEEGVLEFARLNDLTRKEHGLPPQPREFFRNLYRGVLSRGKGFVLLARREGLDRKRAVAGAVFLHIGEKALYKYGASDRSLQHLRANNLVLWEAVRLYTERGFRSFCFGRTEPGNDGLRRFKSGWGAEERVIPYYRYDPKSGTFLPPPECSAGRVWNPMRAAFSRLPRFMLGWIGRVLYRHMG